MTSQPPSVRLRFTVQDHFQRFTEYWSRLRVTHQDKPSTIRVIDSLKPKRWFPYRMTTLIEESIHRLPSTFTDQLCFKLCDSAKNHQDQATRRRRSIDIVIHKPNRRANVRNVLHDAAQVVNIARQPVDLRD